MKKKHELIKKSTLMNFKRTNVYIYDRVTLSVPNIVNQESSINKLLKIN